MSIFSDVIETLKETYPDVNIEGDMISATHMITPTFQLTVFDEKPPAEWIVSNVENNEDCHANETSKENVLLINEFRKTYEKVYDSVKQKQPIENLKAGGFDIQEPEELSPEEKLAMLDDIMDGKIEPASQPINKGACHSHETRVVIPDNVRSMQISALTSEEIKNYLCKTATDQEAYMFVQLCQAQNLNPFLREAYLIKYGDNATMVVGKDAYMRRAESNPKYDGFEAGILVKDVNGALDRREGTFYISKEETLVGGWAKVYRKDMKLPFVAEVSLDEYNTKKSLWLQKAATMIRKVALVQAMREAFPSDFSGMYDAAEMGNVVDAVYEVA